MVSGGCGPDPVIVYGVAAKLGWSNPDTGPVCKRLYALDQGQEPRWARPHARVVEQALMEYGVEEGSRVVVVALDRSVTPLQLDQCVLAAMDAVMATLPREGEDA